MAGTLFLVSTPIGNLEDITLRALRVLREVTLIAAEDTRRTAQLLRHYAIRTPLTSFHSHNERQKLPGLMVRLAADQPLALVSDAGTPTISDPGFHLIKSALGAGSRVEPVPGPSAVLAALVSSGFQTVPFTFLGFAPSRSKDRIQWLNNLVKEHNTIVFFESAKRLLATLDMAFQILGDRQISIARELTKIHEEVVSGTISEILKVILKPPRGEMTVVVGPYQLAAPSLGEAPTPLLLLDEFWHLAKSGGLTRRQSITELARRHGLPSKQVYQALEQAKIYVE